MKAHARTLMTEHVLAARPDQSLAEVARALVAGEHGGAPVVDEDRRVLGFLTEADLVSKMLTGDAERRMVREVMAAPALVVDEFTPIEEVMSLLREAEVNHLPVVRQGKLVGIITPHDVLRYLVEHVLEIPPEDA